MAQEQTRDLLRQNSELRHHRIWNWTIPAWFVELPNGARFHTCPQAGACAQVCYARNGTYRFPAVAAAHLRNLMLYLDDRHAWIEAMLAELMRKKFRPTSHPRDLPTTNDRWLDRWSSHGGAAVRIHDSGDFFSHDYLVDWLHVARLTPDVLFYAYTKEIDLFKNILDPAIVPPNFRYLFSTGGLQDDMIEPDIDRHADVFADEGAIVAAGYQSQSASDLLAIFLGTTMIGIPANRIPQFVKKMNGRRFSEMGQARLHRRHDDRR